MLSDAAQPANDELIETDLCIIGAGPAGITIAREFLGDGRRVCLLESGGRHPERQAQRLNRGQSVGYPVHLLHRSRIRAFGGTSRHWVPDRTWASRPLDPIDFEVRPTVPYSGWPFGRADLEPWYARAHTACDLGPYDYEPDGWVDEARTPRLPLSGPEVETIVFQHAPGTFDGRYDELVRSPNVTVFLHAHVSDLVTDEGSGRVDRVEVRRDDGSRFFVRPRLVVLAAGGIENPRLLLLGHRARGRGLGNDHDLVGRFFTERLSARTGFVVTNRPELVEQAAFYDFHAARGTYAQGALRVADKMQREEGLLNCAFFVLARPWSVTAEAVRSAATLTKGVARRPMPAGIPGHLGNVATGLGDIGAFALARLRRGSGSPGVLVLRAQCEPPPNPESRVRLGSRCDRFGLPVAQVDWRVAESARESIRSSQQRLDAAFRAAGIGHVESMLGDEHPPALFEGNFHHLGATRMHPDPEQGVVDADCRVHGVDNLYVAGSSVFPTYGCSNPTLTLLALALRLAHHVQRVLADRRVP
jgi:choline dehydrogenase-like flavoprotein